MFTGQRERDVSVGMDSETMLWDLLGPILVRDFQKIELRIWILSLCICIPFIYSHAHGRSRIRFFLSYPLYRLSGYFDFFIQCQILLSSCDVDWGWRAIIGSIIEWIYFTLEKSCQFLPRGPVCRESLCSTTIGRNYCDLFLCPAFLWLRLKVSISWTCSNSPSFSQILSQQYVWTLRGTKRYLVLSSLLCPITIRPPTICHIFVSWQNSFSLKGHSILLLFTHKSDNH